MTYLSHPVTHDHAYEAAAQREMDIEDRALAIIEDADRDTLAMSDLWDEFAAVEGTDALVSALVAAAARNDASRYARSEAEQIASLDASLHARQRATNIAEDLLMAAAQRIAARELDEKADECYCDDTSHRVSDHQ